MNKYAVLLAVFVASLSAADTGQDIEALFTPHFDSTTPGCSVSVRHDGKVVYEKGFGLAVLPTRGEAAQTNEPTTRVRMASVTKPVLAVGILHLRDQFLLQSKKDPLTRTLAEIYPTELGESPFAKMTVSELLNHTSTLVREPPPNVPAERALAYWMERSGTASILTGKAIGGHWEYSNLGYMLAGDILSRLSGTYWPLYLKMHLFDPLGMKDTSVEDPIPLQNDGKMAKGYDLVGSFFVWDQVEKTRRILMGSGGMISTAQDMSRFAEAVEQGAVLSKAGWQLAFTPSAASQAIHFSYGLGWTVGSDRVSHNGGGYGSSTRLEVGTKADCLYSVALLCNLNSDDFPRFDDVAVIETIRKLYCR